MKKEKRTVIYRLIGRKNQNEEEQKKDLETFAQSSNLTVTDEFIDNVLPYQQQNRPQLNQLMEAARNQKFDCLLIWKLDCFACSLVHLCEVLQEFNALQIRFISIQDKMDLEGKMTLLAIHTLTKMIEFKSALVRERVKRGMAKAQEKGQIMGRPTILSKQVRLVEELAINTDYSIKKIKMLIGSGISYSAIGVIVKRVRNELNIR